MYLLVYMSIHWCTVVYMAVLECTVVYIGLHECTCMGVHKCTFLRRNKPSIYIALLSVVAVGYTNH